MKFNKHWNRPNTTTIKNNILGLIVLFATFFSACSNQIGEEEMGTIPVAQITNTGIIFENGKELSLPMKADQHRFLLVRHAEKQVSGHDPGLTEKGARRAKKLDQILTGTKIDRVYSTIYKRTTMTARPVVKSQGATMYSYAPDQLDSLANVFVEESRGQTWLIVGHSNTTPAFTGYLAGQEPLPMIPEIQYDDLFFVIREGNGESRLLSLKYNP